MGNRLWVGALAAAAALPLMAGAAGATTAPKSEKPLWRQSHDYWTTQAAPRVADPVQDARVGLPGADETLRARHDTGFPPAAQELARREALAGETEQTPMSLARKAGAKPVQKARLLTLLVEFDPNANDDFSGWARPDPATGGCVTEPAGTTFTARCTTRSRTRRRTAAGATTTRSGCPTSASRYYSKLIYSSKGLTKKVRRDLHGGVDLAAGRCTTTTSRCPRARYEVTGGSARGCALPHSEAWYSADTCEAGEAGDVGPPRQPARHDQMRSTRRGARRGAAGLPVGGLRRRGPGRHGR